MGQNGSGRAQVTGTARGGPPGHSAQAPEEETKETQPGEQTATARAPDSGNGTGLQCGYISFPEPHRFHLHSVRLEEARLPAGGGDGGKECVLFHPRPGLLAPSFPVVTGVSST